MGRRRTNQGGSVATFILVGVILTILLVGAVYFVKQHGDQVRKDQAIATINNQQAAKKPVKTDIDPDGTNESKASSDDKSTSVTNSTGTSEDLPTTGPKMTMIDLFALFAITVTTASYLVSRRKVNHSL